MLNFRKLLKQERWLHRAGRAKLDLMYRGVATLLRCLQFPEIEYGGPQNRGDFKWFDVSIPFKMSPHHIPTAVCSAQKTPP